MTEEKKEEKNVPEQEEIKEKKEEKNVPEKEVTKEEGKVKEKIEKKEEKKEITVKEKEEEEIEIPKKFKKLVDEIGNMSVLDLAELVKILEKKFGVSAQAPVVAAASIAPEVEQPTEEKAVFNIELKKVGDKKIEVIKLVRDITEKGLKESKDLVDAAASSPQPVKENVKKEEAEEMKKKFTEAGAEIELK